MTIRARMTFWYSGVLLVSGLAIAVLSVRELREQRNEPNEPGEGWQEVVGLVCWIGLPAAILSIGGGWLLMRKALAPIAALTRAAEQISEQNLNQQLTRAHNGDELDRLTQVLNAMTARLHNSFARIREFTLHASHELKTPLTVMQGELEADLADQTITPAQRERLLSQLDEVQRLVKIVDGLMLLTKADAGQVALARNPVPLNELVREAFEDAEVLARPYSVQVRLNGIVEATISGDRHRLRQMLLNLTDNAVKYNHCGGTAEMHLTRNNGSAVVTIRNTGPGITAAILPRVFDRFFRGDAAHSQAVEGCGLGLSIARWIATAHGGSIDLHSNGASETTVIVRLPLVEGS